MFDLGEPLHVHVRSGHKQAKFWVDSRAVAWTRGYRSHELNEIERIIRDNEALIRDIWNKESSKKR